MRLLFACLVACAFLLHAAPGRADTHKLRVGTLAPKNSAWGKVFKVWQKALSQKSGGKLELDYLDLLHAHWVVDHATLSTRDKRGEAARSILDQSKGVARDIAASEGESDDGPRSIRGPTSKRTPGAGAEPG